MRRLGKKLIYYLGSITLAVVLFLTGYLLISKSPEVTVDTTSSSGIGLSSSSGSWEEDSGSSGGFGSDSNGGSGDSSGGGGGGGNAPDGGGGGSGGGGGNGGNDPTYWFRVKASTSQRMYLRSDSKGDYVGSGYHGFMGNSNYYMDEGDLHPLFYFAEALAQSKYKRNIAEIELNLEKAELLPYFTNKKIESDAGAMQYAVYYYQFDYMQAGTAGVRPLTQNATYASQERAYRDFVYDTYLDIDDDLKTLLLDLAEENGVGVKSTLVEDVAYYISHAARYNLYYEEYPDGSDMVTHFLTEAKEGVCRHYAAAATMMYRAFGIPARYTHGYAIDTIAGEWVEWYDAGHAWTEIYIDGYGWVPIEVTGSASGGGNGDGDFGELPDSSIDEDSSDSSSKDSTSGSDFDYSEDNSSSEDSSSDNNKKYSLTIVTKSATKEYDGTPLRDVGFTTAHSSLPSGYRLEIVDRTELTNVGSVSNDVKVVVVDANGNEVDDVKITVKYGTLTVTPKTVQVRTGSAESTGVTLLTCSEYTVESGLIDGDRLTLNCSGRQVGAGSSMNTVDLRSVRIVNKYGQDVTKNYSIEYIYGWLTIYPST